MYKQALKKKVRFQTGKLEITIEDLFTLDEIALDNIAKNINKELKSSQEESFLTPKSTGNSVLNLKLEILKDIIADKMLEKEEKTKEKERKFYNDLLKKRELEEFDTMPIEEIQKRLKSLG